MPFFYYKGAIKPGETISLKGGETRHIRLSRKIRPGEEIQLQDQELRRFACRVDLVRNSYVECTPVREVPTPPEPLHKLSLAVALPKEKAMDFILQKSVETGVHTLYFFETEFSLRLPQGEAKTGRLGRWEKIMEEACKQCGRLAPPKLELGTDVFSLASEFAGEALVLHPAEPHCGAEQLSRTASQTLLIVGPEGGLSKDDLSRLPSSYLHLGPRILRCETAAIAGASLLQFLRGDMSGVAQTQK